MTFFRLHIHPVVHVNDIDLPQTESNPVTEFAFTVKIVYLLVYEKTVLAKCPNADLISYTYDSVICFLF